jgi:beta-mannosidase
VRLFDLYTYGESVDETCERIRALYGDAELSFFEKLPEYPAFSSVVSEGTLGELLTLPLPNPYSRAAEDLIPNIDDTVAMLSREFPYPSDLSDIAYLSQLLAARRLDSEMLLRRLSSGEVGRAVFDGIAPATQANSPAVLDGGLRYKAALYRAKSFFSPVVLTASAEGASVAFSVVNSRRSELSGEIEFSVIDNANNKVYSGRENCTVGEGEARRLFVADVSEFILGFESERYLEYILREGSTVLSRGILLFVPTKHFEFKNPAIRHEISGSQRRYSVTLSAECFAYMTELSFGSLPVRLSDNYLSLSSRSPVKVSFETPGADLSLSELESALKIRSIYDVINP